jgi:hypothetical protein
MRCRSKLLLLSDALLPVEIFLSADFGKLEIDSGPESKLLPDFRLELVISIPKCTENRTTFIRNLGNF